MSSWGQGVAAEQGVATPHTAVGALDTALTGLVNALSCSASHAWRAGKQMSHEFFAYL
jgi:hypothetical protein